MLAGGRLTVEDAYAYAKFARVAAGTNDVDFRARPHSAEELDFLAAHVVGTGPEHLSYAALEAAPAVLCVALEPEEEAPIVFLRLRKAARKHRQRVFHLGQWSTPGGAAHRAGARRRRAGRPGQPDPGGARRRGRGAGRAARARARSALAGRRRDPGRRAGGRGARAVLRGVRAGRAHRRPDRLGPAAGRRPRRARRRRRARPCCPAAARSTDAAARAELEQAWGLAAGRAAGRARAGTPTPSWTRRPAGRLAALVVGGVDPHDLADPAAALAALRRVGFLVSLELQHSAVTELADVVLPVAPDAQSAGSYLNWEGRLRAFGPALDASGVLPDCRVLDTLAVEMDVDIFTQTPAAAAGELARLGAVARVGAAAAGRRRPQPMRPGYGQAVLATWRQLIDVGSLAVDEPALAGTARPPLVRMQRGHRGAARAGRGRAGHRAHRAGRDHAAAGAGRPARRGGLAAGNSPGSRVRTELGVGHGDWSSP